MYYNNSFYNGYSSIPPTSFFIYTYEVFSTNLKTHPHNSTKSEKLVTLCSKGQPIFRSTEIVSELSNLGVVKIYRTSAAYLSEIVFNNV